MCRKVKEGFALFSSKGPDIKKKKIQFVKKAKSMFISLRIIYDYEVSKINKKNLLDLYFVI